MKTSDIPAPVWYVGGLAVAGVVAYFLIKKGASTAANALNPLNNNNVISQGANSVLQGLGVVDQGSSIGSTIYDWFHPEYDPNSTATAKPLIPSFTGQGGATDPSAGWVSSLFGGSSAPYDYGSAGAGGVPYRYGVNPLPDAFNLSSTNWLI